jgi:hypothetical protein
LVMDFHPKRFSVRVRVSISGFGFGCTETPPDPNPTRCHPYSTWAGSCLGLGDWRSEVGSQLWPCRGWPAPAAARTVVAFVDVTPFWKASTLLPSESGVILLVAPHFVVLSLGALLPHLIIGLTTLLPPLASAHTTYCQVLAVNNHLCRSLAHLSASSHHMLDCGDLDLLSGSPRSPPGGPPPNGVGGRQLEPRCSHRRCNSCMVVAGLFSLNVLQPLGCRLFGADSLTAACELKIFRVCFWWWHRSETWCSH